MIRTLYKGLPFETIKILPQIIIANKNNKNKIILIRPIMKEYYV